MNIAANPWRAFETWKLEDYLRFREHDDLIYDEIAAELERRNQEPIEADQLDIMRKVTLEANNE